MVFWLDSIDIFKKRAILALLIVLMSSAWTPIAKELFLGFMNTEIFAGVTIGLVISLFGLIGAWGIYKRWF